MEILITGGAVLGGVLGRFFRVLILAPVCSLLLTLLLIKSSLIGLPLLGSFVKISLLIAGLELGYFMGLLSTDMSLVVQCFRGLLTRSYLTALSRTAHLK